jgi:hypothetical protein
MAVLPVGIGSEEGGYQIERSLRFNSADSAYLNRTFGSAGDRKTFTISMWVKRSSLSSSFRRLLSGSGGNFHFRFTSAHQLSTNFQSSGTNYVLTSTQVFRDTSAYYHFVAAYDTTQATSSNRIKFYVNGEQITAFGTANYPPQNAESEINAAAAHYLFSYDGSSEFFDGYATEINFIDGSALDPTSFGEFNTDTGVWQPKAYTGSYGTNGFYLDFADNSGTTSTTLGADSSGNGNNWTPNNFSVTAGAGNDSLVDSPTRYGTDTGAGGEVRGNYCTLNPLTTTAGTYSQGNLRYVAAAAWRRSNATIPVSTGKWYWEVTLGNAPETPRVAGSARNALGFGVSTSFNSTTDPSNISDGVVLSDNGYYKNFSGSWTDGGTAFSSGDVLSIAVDLDANSYTLRRNNTQIATGTIGGTAGRELVPIIISYDGLYGVMDCNFGQRPFAYTAPSGFKALVTTNLPEPTIEDGGEYFNTVLYTGTGSAGNSITGVGFETDFTWIKNRSSASGQHLLLDRNRGILNKVLISNTTDAELTSTVFNSTNSDGYVIDATGAGANASGNTYVAWNWKANGAGVSNTDGTITSTVSVNTTSGFSIVTYTGNGTAGATVGHGLGATPSMMIVKKRSATPSPEPWAVYHASLGATKGIYLNTTGTPFTLDIYWDDTAPTSSVFSIGDWDGINTSSQPYVAYCFAPVAGYSAFGSYTGNGSADGPMVYTGFRPAFVITKCSSTTDRSWSMKDSARSPFNLAQANLSANYSDAEGTTEGIDMLSNGFKIRQAGSDTNTSGQTYIFMAFAENPFSIALAR